MIALTADIMKEISPHLNAALVDGLVEGLPTAMDRFEINTLLRAANFLGQCAEESAGFRTLTEYASGREYEGRADLGNTHPGDGERYKGRGLIMLTGRYNYDVYGKKLGIDFVDHPDYAQDPRYAALTACQFWHDHNLNAYADEDNIQMITRRINGGENGLADRMLYTKRAKQALASLFD